MDSEKFKKRQSFKVIISEFIMVLAVIATVIVLAFVVSGYWVNSDFKVERQGMIQVSSIPTGADFDVDGESSWLQRTNTSKVLSSGEHTVTLTKEGYDTWTKTIDITEGLLYRIHYPRLFLQNRESEHVLDVTGSKLATVSPDNKELLMVNGTTEWQIINLARDSLKPEQLDLSRVLPGTSLAEGAKVGIFDGQILDSDWDRNGRHVLMEIKTGDDTEWVLIDTENAKESLNLTREFGADFSDIKILDDSSSSLLAVQNQNLHKINIPNKSISAVLVEDIVSFDHYEDEIVFSASKDGQKYAIGLIKADGDEATKLESSDSSAEVTISKFYDDMYITVRKGEKVSLYKKTDFTLVSDFNLTFTPETMEVGHDGEFITMISGPKIATLDMEANTVREWSIEGSNFGWIDNDMIYSVADGELIVYDFDGFNQRALAKNVSSHFPVTITDNRWLYYFSDGELVREWLIPR